jgi:sec-independent protein translocase protein TatB
MNIFSNIGITELIVILLLALLVVGPERLPELARKLGETLRDVRQAYENLTQDLGPELESIQQSTQDLRESVESVRSIPKDMVRSVTKTAELDETIKDIKKVTDGVSQTIAETEKTLQEPIETTVRQARGALLESDETAQTADEARKERADEGEEEPTQKPANGAEP